MAIENGSRSCDVCSSDRKHLIYEHRFSAISGGVLTGYELTVCDRCGFAFADGIPEQATFDAYYRDMSKYEFGHHGGQESSYDLARLREIAALVRPYLSPEARILDVGCGNGRLLAVLKENGFPRVLGLDPSPRCGDIASRLYGVRVLTGTLSDFPVPDKSVDFLIAAGVLEHLRDLRVALRRLKAVLPERGRIFLEVPDATRFASSENAPFQEFSTEHINFFSPASLTNLMRSEGFVPLLVEQNDRRSNQSTVEPAVSGVFEHDSKATIDPVFDGDTERCLLEYVRRSQEVDQKIHVIIEELVAANVKLVVWGVGTHTQRLMATSPLSQAHIRAFVDSNQRYHGKELDGIPIIPPAELHNYHEPVVI